MAYEEQSGLGLTERGNVFGDTQDRWRATGVRDITPGGSQAERVARESEDPLTYWRAHHNEPGYAERSIINERNQAQLEEIRQKAQFDAENFEKRYTAKQKAEIARWNQAKNDIDLNPNFSDTEKIAAKRGIDFQILGIKPADLPRLSPRPKGRDTGDVWEEGGVTFVGKADGESWQVDENKTVRGQAFKAKTEMEKEEIKHQQSRELEILKLRAKLLETEVVDTTKLDAKGKPTSRTLTEKEIQDRINLITGMNPTAKPQKSEGYQLRPGGLSASGKFKWDGTQWIPNPGAM